MTLRELETQILIARAATEAALTGFRGDPVVGLDGENRQETHRRLAEAERNLCSALDEVQCANTIRQVRA